METYDPILDLWQITDFWITQLRLKDYSFSMVVPDMMTELAILQLFPILQFLPIMDLKTDTFSSIFAPSETSESITEELFS